MKIDAHTGQNKHPILSDRFIEELISVPKHISGDIKSPFKGREYDDGNIRLSTDVCSDDGKYKFIISTRLLIDSPSNFSVIFRYINPEGREYMIRRYNGNHGRHYHKYTNTYISGPHIHTMTERAQSKFRKDETEALETDRYQTLEQALDYALSDLNIKTKHEDIERSGE